MTICGFCKVKNGSHRMTQKNTEFLYKEITEQIIGAAFEVYKVLGYGFLEKVYHKALVVELKLRRLPIEEEYAIKVIYENEIVGEYYADIFVERKVIVEIKVDDKYNSQHEAQLLNYLKATGIKIGLVINFGKSKCEFKRLIF